MSILAIAAAAFTAGTALTALIALHLTAHHDRQRRGGMLDLTGHKHLIQPDPDDWFTDHIEPAIDSARHEPRVRSKG